MSQLDEECVELKGEGTIAESDQLRPSFIEHSGVDPIEPTEVEEGLLAGSVSNTTGGGHLPVLMALDGGGGEDHARGIVQNT